MFSNSSFKTSIADMDGKIKVYSHSLSLINSYFRTGNNEPLHNFVKFTPFDDIRQEIETMFP